MYRGALSPQEAAVIDYLKHHAKPLPFQRKYAAISGLQQSMPALEIIKGRTGTTQTGYGKMHEKMQEGAPIDGI